MLPELHLLGATLQTYGLCVALAVVAAGLLLHRRFRELGWGLEDSAEAVLAAVVGGFAGARLWWLAEHAAEAGADPVGSLLGGEGFTWYGGVLGATLAVLAWARWRGRLVPSLAGAATAPAALGYAVGRIGCQLSGDGDYGRPSDVPWAMAYPDGIVPTTVPVHPTPVYETLAMGAAAVLLWRLRDRLGPAALLGLYLVLAGLERFLVEFVRRNPDEVAGMTTAQLVALASVAGGAWCLYRGRHQRPSRRVDRPDAADARAAAPGA